MRAEWSTEDLVGSWTLVDEDWQLVGNKTGATRLGFALLLKFFEIEARFPVGAEELPPIAVAYVADQVGMHAAELAPYRWTGRTIEYHRAQIRGAFGFRQFSRGDHDKLATWLAEEVCPIELREAPLREALLVRCRTERIEPPGMPDRIIATARSLFEKSFCELVVLRLGAACAHRLEALVTGADGGGRGGQLAELKADPGQVSLDTLLREIDKLTAVKTLQMPPGLFADCSERLVEAWRARATRSVPVGPGRCRAAGAADLVGGTLLDAAGRDHRRAGGPVARAGAQDQHQGRPSGRARAHRGSAAGARQGRDPFRLAAAAVDHRDDTVRAALFPVVGEGTLRELVREAKANQRAFQARVRTVLHSSYTHHYRR